ncbi:MAG TPA: hypothetical protein VER58_12895 [Thermoanaerobaculia bacterium]|nr:hypothetical protein [Thermoanaerobaculia bacterium]
MSRIRIAAAAIGVCLIGCAATVPLDHAVIAYDITTAESVEKQLLLNIARARNNQPIHFTAVSSITATYRLTTNAGIGPALTGNRGGLVVPLLGTSAESSPTISIAPMQGDEFTQRLLTPFREAQLTLLLRQGYDVDALLRLLGAEIRLDRDGTGVTTIHKNRPSDREGYQAFRRVVAHLSAIQDRHALYVEPLHFTHTWTVPEASVTPETYESTYKDFTIAHDVAEHVYRVSKRINGRVMITNYDPDILSNEERLHLHQKAEEAPYNDVLIDIRAGQIGGEFPIHGRLRLRSFHEVLTFIGRGISEEPEFDVAPDPRTPPVSENPRSTLEIFEGPQPPRDGRAAVHWNGSYYAVQPQSGYQWNHKTFGVLYQLFQMSVSSVTPAGPSITIAK